MTPTTRVPGPGLRRRASPALPAVTVAAVASATWVLLLVLVTSRWSPLRTLDQGVADGLNDATAPHPLAVDWWRAVSTVGQPFTFQALSVLAALVLWRRGRRPQAVLTAVTVIGAGLLSRVTKSLVDRDRPVVDVVLSHASGSSFPSGHALASFVGVAVLLVVVLPALDVRSRVVTGAGVLVVLLVAASRLALGMHYVSDVVGAWLLGTAWVALALLVRRLLPQALLRRSPRR